MDELTDEQILSLVNETAIAVDRLQLETMMFERYFDKLGGVGDGGGSTAGVDIYFRFSHTMIIS